MQSNTRNILNILNIFTLATILVLASQIQIIGNANAKNSRKTRANVTHKAKRKLVVVISRGLDDERASVAWSIANGGIKSGLDVSVFLVSSGVDWVRKGAADRARLNPLDPSVGTMIQSVVENGSAIGVCPVGGEKLICAR